MRPRPSTLPVATINLSLSHFASYSSTLFARNGDAQALSHQSVAHSFPLNGGMGYVRPSSPAQASIRSTCQCPLPPLCFQSFPTIKFRNPFALILITIQNAPGVWGLLVQRIGGNPGVATPKEEKPVGR